MTRIFYCSTCGIQGHNKNNKKFHPIVPVCLPVIKDESDDEEEEEDCCFKCGNTGVFGETHFYAQPEKDGEENLYCNDCDVKSWHEKEDWVVCCAEPEPEPEPEFKFEELVMDVKEKFEKVKWDLRRNVRVVDPLIIELNKHSFRKDPKLGRIVAEASADIDKRCVRESELYQNPHTPQSYWKIKTIIPIVKYYEIKFV
jgi:hypothetical protein